MTHALLVLDQAVAGHGGPVTAPTSFALSRGECLGLLGPNGVGKSTLLHAVLGTARLWSGQIRRQAGLRLRHLPQRPARPAELPLTGREMLTHLGALAIPPPPSLARRLDQRVDRLSGGEYQLLCLWACLAGDADLVLLDEPTNNLDRAHTYLAAEEINAERGRRATLIVSHDLAFLERTCTRVIDLAGSIAGGNEA